MIDEKRFFAKTKRHSLGAFQRQIAEEVGVSRVQIGNILSRKQWAHVELEQST